MCSVLFGASNRELISPMYFRNYYKCKFTCGVPTVYTSRVENSCHMKTEAGIMLKYKLDAVNMEKNATLFPGRTKGEEGPPRRLKEV